MTTRVRESYPHEAGPGDDVAAARRAALAAAGVHARRAATILGRVGLGCCGFGPGRLAVALAGPSFERAGLRRLEALGRELDLLACHELVIDCAALSGCEPALGRALTRLRIQALTRGATVALNQPPQLLAAQLGPRPATAFTVHTDQ